MAPPYPKLEDFLAHRHVYNTRWPGIYEVISSRGDRRYRVVHPGDICQCPRGIYDQPCRHLLLVLIRRGGSIDAYSRYSRYLASWRGGRSRRSFRGAA